MNKLKPILKLNLQHFAEPAEPALRQEQAPQVAPQPVQAAPQLDINEIVSNLSNRINDTLNQRLSPIEQKLNAPVQPTREEIEEQNEQIRQQFETDPMGFVKQIQEQAKQSAMDEFKNKYDPMLQQTEQLNNKFKWQDTVRQFTSENPEAQKNMPQIIQVLNENPELMGTKDPLGIAYKLAASNNLLGNGGNIVDNVLGNEEYVKQIMQNPTLKEQIIQEYQQGLNNGTSQKLPPIMGNGQGGSIPVSGGETPKNLKEARMSALRRFQ